MKCELVVAEKPAQALKIAAALADGKVETRKDGKVSYFLLTHRGKSLVVVSAVGHLFNLAVKGKTRGYPIFDFEWKEAYLVNKRKSDFTKKYVDVIRKLCKDADGFVVACDYDNEGSVIGANVVRFICKQKDARRMKFSTLTRDELVESYERASRSLDWPQINAGEARHSLDWLYGLNLSRALMSAIKAAGAFAVMSAGRVQGPALKILVDREREIAAFKPEDFWQVSLEKDVGGRRLVAWHVRDKFWRKEEADVVVRKTKGGDGVVRGFEAKEFVQAPPHPFDLTSLQLEAYRVFGISPKEAQAIAQELYVAGLISYPRTSSQQLPGSIQYRKILSELGKQGEYAALCEELLARETLVPHDGKKTDPAHPAIYPTGEFAKLEERKWKVYDLIVRRTLATFAEPARRQSLRLEVDVGGEVFVANGTMTVFEGWHRFYVYGRLKEEDLPRLKRGDILVAPVISEVAGQTKPPKRYTPASVIKELESRGLGTKATRASIVDALYQRSYVVEKSIEATRLGVKTIETLEKFCPEIIDEELTRHFERYMDGIMEGKRSKEGVIEEAKVALAKTLERFKKNEGKIGENLLEATRETQRVASTVAACRVCGKGILMIRRGRFGLFVACDQYPGCKTTFSLPAGTALAKPTGQKCPECSFPVLVVIRPGKRFFNYCINKQCPRKLAWIEEQKANGKWKELRREVRGG